MSILERIKLYLRRLRRRSAYKNNTTPLREFIYLDDVSVYSLLASRLGPIAAEFTDSESRSLQSEISGGFVGGAGALKANIGSRIENTKVQGSQVVRKSIIQNTFKELYELEAKTIVMKPLIDVTGHDYVKSRDSLNEAQSLLVEKGLVVVPTQLARGSLVEVEIQLEAEALFRVSTIASAVLEIVEDDPELFNVTKDLGQIRSVSRVLEKLLSGLVPIRGLATDYKILELNDTEIILHNAVLDIMLKENPTLQTHPLYIVGVTEQSLFWKDIRRVLFSSARFRALCRVAQNGLQNEWTAVKLVHVLETFAPEIASQLNSAGVEALTMMTKAVSQDDVALQNQQAMKKKAVICYAQLLTEHYGHRISEQELETEGILYSLQDLPFIDVRTKRQVFTLVADYLVRKFDIKLGKDIAAKYRMEALLWAGFPPSGEATQMLPQIGTRPLSQVDERYLDVEFVAIYW